MAQGESVQLRELSLLLLPVLKTVEGIYHKGQIELVELPQDAIAWLQCWDSEFYR